MEKIIYEKAVTEFFSVTQKKAGERVTRKIIPP